MRHSIAFGVLASLLALASSSAAQDAGGDAHPLFPAPPEVTRLPSGLRIISIPWPSPGIVAYYTLVRVGSRDEVEAGHSGFAHLFEHMMFRGTEAMSGDEYERRIQALGADNNAYTTRDFTMYTVTAPAEELASVVNLEAERFQRLSFSEEDYRTETGAVQGEYAKSASSPSLPMWEALSGLAFREHTYGHTTLGALRDICAMPDEVAYARRFFSRFYTPDNTTILVAGDVEHGALVREVRRAYGRWRGRRARVNVPAESTVRSGSEHLVWNGSAPPRMHLGYRTPAFAGGARSAAARRAALRETAALDVARSLVLSEASPLVQRLVTQERTLLQLVGYAQPTRDPGLFVVSATFPPPAETPAAAARDAAFDAVQDAVQAAFDGLARGDVDAARFQRTRSHLRYALIADVSTPSDAADLLGRMIAVGGESDDLTRYLAALDAVTAEDVARVAGAYLVPARRVRVTLAPPSPGESAPERREPLCPEAE
ncbi:MAG: pitrilysin family protein [Myxococcota bacterium]